jgi:hypothetical protein
MVREIFLILLQVYGNMFVISDLHYDINYSPNYSPPFCKESGIFDEKDSGVITNDFKMSGRKF